MQLEDNKLKVVSPTTPDPIKTDKDYAIVFNNVSRQYRLHHETNLTLQDKFVNFFKRQKNYEDFWALKDVSFKLEKGKTIGIIGRNGAGKSTLLKLATRVLEPSNGVIRVNGRISAMLELGTGFHPELSARDNIYLNGAFYGFDKQGMDERFERIVEFSELGKFIDTPVKHYSSGMYMRLGFAVAITVEPDILVIDEVLAVGDAAFGRKCRRAIEDLKQQSKAMLFVSHAAGEVSRLCDEVIYLDRGRVVAQGRPGDILDEYMMASMGPTYFVTQSSGSEKTSASSEKNSLGVTPLNAATANNGSTKNGQKESNPTANKKKDVTPVAKSAQEKPTVATPKTPTQPTPAAISSLSLEELLLAAQADKMQLPHVQRRLQVKRGILGRELYPVWNFKLPEDVRKNLNDPNNTAEYYIAIINNEDEAQKIELQGLKESNNQFDQATGALRAVPMHNFNIDPGRFMLVKLEEGALLNIDSLLLKASTKVAVEMVVFNGPQLDNSPESNNFIASAFYHIFPFCDIRGDNLCRFELVNPHATTSEISLNIYRELGGVMHHLRTYQLEAYSRLQIDLNEELANGDGELRHAEKFYGGVAFQSTNWRQDFYAVRQQALLQSPQIHLLSGQPTEVK